MEIEETENKTNKEEEKKEPSRQKTITLAPRLKKESERSNLLAKSLTKETFLGLWDIYKAKEDTSKMTKEEIAQQLFYLGAKTAFEQKSKDYTDMKRGNDYRKIEEMKTQRKLKEIKRNIFKIKENKGLDIKKTIKDLKSAIRENSDNQRITEELKKEIEFLKDYDKKRKKDLD
ncbi:MAG: hypothetical protein KAI18_00305 [Candidatus Aenigmarchaeota archaeon]|nr:hypothetical protein [Candidatus Aenigmarchaeota archaeon]